VITTYYSYKFVKLYDLFSAVMRRVVAPSEENHCRVLQRKYLDHEVHF